MRNYDYIYFQKKQKKVSKHNKVSEVIIILAATLLWGGFIYLIFTI